DHFNKTAVEKYLNRTSEGLKPVFGENLGKSIRAMFCDSIELSGANWTGDFREQFQERNGYDVWEYLPLVLNNETEATGDFADTLLRVRYDYYATLSELFTERFIITFNNWCHQMGVQSRYQAYGTPWVPTDLLDGNMIPDIPEGDQWLFNGGWTATQLDQIRYAIWDKYTSSAAHLRGLKIASCESMTNTSGVFSASLEYIKQATDINVIAGINHLVLHGWNYSPPEAGFPGWIRYGTYFNQQNPWFLYLHLWSEYAARLNFIFQHSQAVSQVAIIGPTADRWSESGLNRNPFLTDPWYLHSLWQAMNHHGYCSDYLNPRVFQEATFENGEIIYGPMHYQALIICDMQTAFPEFIDALTKYAQSGGKIIFIGRTPYKSQGMRYKSDNSVQQKIKYLLDKFNENVMVSEEPEKETITDWAGSLLQFQNVNPGVKISDPDERLYLYQAKHEDKPVFFFSNQNRDKAIAFDAEFEDGNLYPWKWNAETGEKSMYSYNQNSVYIHLKPLESLLLIFSEEKGDIQKEQQMPIKKELNISQNWQATFATPEGETFTKDIPELGDIARMPGLETFSGTIIYRKNFQTEGRQARLELGKVAETAEVTLNGQNLGVKWWGEKTFDISKALKTGDNELEIKVTTLLWNHCNSKTMEENPMAKHWANSNRDKSNKPLPTGLIGPVKIS
ncbi:MAG TPA: glycosyl hydrolase, partial [Draconibacterium sp.]|nr:glycosyl hydrolase [Draconibacterium sp.]